MDQPKQKLLLIEDDEVLRKGLIDLFEHHGFEVSAASDGETGLHMALTRRFDVILVDVMLPRLDGFSVCNQIRSQDRETAIIALTARSSDEDVVEGFTLGVDDYITKPFSVNELVLRVGAVIRRTAKDRIPDTTFRLRDFIAIDPAVLRGTLCDSSCTEVLFTKREMDLLVYLKSNQNRVVSRAELLSALWGYRPGSLVETRTIDIHVVKLRKKIEPNPNKPQFLQTVRAEGYQLCGIV